MAVQWVRLIDIPGVVLVNSYYHTANCPPSLAVALQRYTIPNNPGYVFTGRHRMVVTAMEQGADLIGVRYHLWVSTGGWTGLMPPAQYPAVGVYLYDETYAPCLALLDGDPGTTPAIFFYSANSMSVYNEGDAGFCDWHLEVEVDYDPPPPPKFWQDFVGCKEIQA